MIVARYLVRGARWLVAWAIGVQLVAVVCFAIGNGMANDPIRESVSEWPGVLWLRYPLFGAGVTAVAAWMVPLLANGLTRRRYLQGLVLFGGAIAILAGVFVAVACAVERLVYAVGGWDADLSGAETPSLAAMYMVLVFAYVTAGALIGAGFQRFDPKWAVPFIAIAAVPPFIAEVLVRPGEEFPLALAIGLPMALAASAIGIGGLWLLLRDLSVRPRSA